MNLNCKTTSKPPVGEPLLVDGHEAARLLGISARTLWSQTAPRGSIPVVRLGSRALYSVDALREFIAKVSSQSHENSPQER